MSEEYRDPARGPSVRPRNNNAMGWTLGLVVAAAVIRVAYYGMGGHFTSSVPTAANPGAVASAPAPAAGVPAPAPEETTGRTPPKAQ
jgi:hypothetical protein